MARFNAFQELLDHIYFRMQFKEKHPQCADCEHVESLDLTRHYYYNYMRYEICSKCDKYEDGEEHE